MDIPLDELRKLYKKVYQDKCKKYPDMEEKNVLPAVSRIVAIGDLHGDLTETINILKLAKVISYNNTTKKATWIGGDTVVVQVGDQIDRCRSLPCNQMSPHEDENSDIKILKLLTDLHSQAILKGGAFYSLVGNHELMNVTGRMEYVSPANYDRFEQKKENKEFLGKKNLKGIAARKDAFKPGNPIAEFLACTRKLILKIGKSVFVHAGIVPEITQKYSNIGDMNKIMSLYLWNKLDRPEMYQDVLGSDVVKGQTFIDRNEMCNNKSCYEISPLWTRKIGYLQDSNKECSKIFDALLDAYGGERMIVGHTPQLTVGINSICNDRLFFVDYAASSAFDVADINVMSRGERSVSRNTQFLEIINDNTVRIVKDED